MELPEKFVTRTTYARMRGLSYLAVRDACEQGRITLFPGNLIDPEQADRDWAANTDATRGTTVAAAMEKRGNGQANGSPVAPTFNAVRTQHEQLRLELAKADLEERRGDTVRKKDVEEAQREAAERVKQAVLQVSQQCAAAWAAASTPAECRRIADVALRAALAGALPGA